MRKILRAPATCALAGLAMTSCSGGDGDSGSLFGTDSASASATATASTATTSTTGSSGGASGGGTSSGGTASGGSGAGSTTGPKFDIGGASDTTGSCSPGDPMCKGCTAVDVLFIVDNSGSMESHKPSIVAAFDPFVDQMINTLPPGTSLHVGVTRGTGFFDPGNSSSCCTQQCEPNDVDGNYEAPETAGDNGVNGQQGRLYEQAGQRYFEIDTDADPAPLKTWFEAALAGAIAGDEHSNTETVVAGAAYPFHPVNATVNAGFMRQQAVLVLFLISDTVDMTPASVTTQSFIDIVSDAKAACGDMCVLTAGVVADGCYETAGHTNTRLYDFMNGFGKPPAAVAPLPLFGGQPDWAGVLGDALSDVIATTCENIPPQG